MLKIIKWIFSGKLKRKKIPPFFFIIFFFFSSITLWILDHHVVINDIFHHLIQIYIALVPYLSLFSLVALIDIRKEERKKDANSKKNKVMAKFLPYSYDLADIYFWLRKSNEPDVLYVKGKNDNIIKIEILCDFDTRTRQFFDKEILINEKVIIINDIQSTIESQCYITCDNKVTVLAITEMNDPSLFQKIIDNLKE